MRPRERYLREGPTHLSELELLQLVLGSGGAGRSVTRLAGDLLERFDGAAGLARAEPEELLAVTGVGPAQAARVHAALTLGRRALATSEDSVSVVRSLDDATQLLAPPLRGLAQEELHAAFLDRRHRVLGWRALTRGSDAYTVVDPRHIFQIALRLGASGVLLAHNHPSGDPTPSEADREVTRRVDRAGRVLGVRLLDHLVVGDRDVRSLASEGMLTTWIRGPLATAE